MYAGAMYTLHLNTATTTTTYNVLVVIWRILTANTLIRLTEHLRTVEHDSLEPAAAGAASSPTPGGIHRRRRRRRRRRDAAVFWDADRDVGERGQHAADAHAPHRPEPAGRRRPARAEDVGRVAQDQVHQRLDEREHGHLRQRGAELRRRRLLYAAEHSC
jgi:hypothetical protein